jgi:fructokinase
MSNLITCMGEILVDFIPIEEHGAAGGFRMYPGGSPFNVAVGLARLEQPVAFCGKLGSDYFGRFLHTHLEQQDVSPRLLLHDEQALTTLAFVAMEAGEAVYTFYDQGAADTLLTPEELPAALLRDTRMLHFGSISLLRGTTPAAVLAAVEQLQGRALLSFDPNLRPGLVQDEPAYRALIDRLVGLSDIVKLSAADIAWLAPDQPIEAAAASILERGAAMVVVTQGNAGVLVLRASDTAATPQHWQVPALPVQVIDTVGAGDSFSSGLLAALAERGVYSRQALLHLSSEDLYDIIRFAAAVSALTCTRAGADPPRRDEVLHILHES